MSNPLTSIFKPGSSETQARLMATPSRRGLAGNLLVAGALAVFVAGTYWKTLHNVSSDDLEKELEREIAEEERRQRKAEAAAAAAEPAKQ